MGEGTPINPHELTHIMGVHRYPPFFLRCHAQSTVRPHLAGQPEQPPSCVKLHVQVTVIKQAEVYPLPYDLQVWVTMIR